MVINNGLMVFYSFKGKESILNIVDLYEIHEKGAGGFVFKFKNSKEIMVYALNCRERRELCNIINKLGEIKRNYSKKYDDEMKVKNFF